MLHPHEFLIVRSTLPADCVPALQRRFWATTKLTMLFANYSDRSEAVAYATAVYPGDGSVLIEPPLDLNGNFSGDGRAITRGLTGFAALGAVLVDDIDPQRIYRAAGLGAPDRSDTYLDDQFAALADSAMHALPPLLTTVAKLDLRDALLPRLRKPALDVVKDGHALMALARMACELMEKTTLWHVAETTNGDDFKAPRLVLDHPLATDGLARQTLYRVAGRSRTYVRAMVHTSRFASR